MKNLAISVPKPCHEKWDSFTPTARGGHCHLCQKEVIDFSNWSEDRLLSYFKKGNQSCGRFRADQLKVYTIPAPPSRSQHWLSVLLISIAIIFSGRGVAAQSNKRAPVLTEQRVTDSIASTSSVDSLVVTGIIRAGDDRSAIPGVNILRKNTSEGTVSDSEGRYSITIKNPGETEALAFSFIGFVNQEIQLSKNSPRHVIDVTLAADVTGLGEVVVVGGVISVSRYSPRRLWWKVKGIFRRD